MAIKNNSVSLLIVSVPSKTAGTVCTLFNASQRFWTYIVLSLITNDMEQIKGN